MTNHLPADADIWVLAGQSNMAGSGSGEPYEPPSDRVWLFSLRDEWRMAEEPFTIDRYDAVDEAFAIMRGEFNAHLADPGYRARRSAVFPAAVRLPRGGGGLGLSFGKALAEYTGKPVGLIGGYAHGGMGSRIRRASLHGALPRHPSAH